MADVKSIKVNNTSYNVKDTTARTMAGTVNVAKSSNGVTFTDANGVSTEIEISGGSIVPQGAFVYVDDNDNLFLKPGYLHGHRISTQPNTYLSGETTVYIKPPYQQAFYGGSDYKASGHFWTVDFTNINKIKVKARRELSTSTNSKYAGVGIFSTSPANLDTTPVKKTAILETETEIDCSDITGTNYLYIYSTSYHLIDLKYVIAE